MSRKDDLENNIRESFDIIRKYEAIIRTSDRPEEKARARRIIQEQQKLIESYLVEYRALISMPDDIAQILTLFSSATQGGNARGEAEQKRDSSTFTFPYQPFEPEMILIPAGEFLMGSDPQKDKDAEDAEQPQHILYLQDYYISKTPVTNAQCLAFVRSTGYDSPVHWRSGRPQSGQEDHPVVWVSWHDAVAYCRWLSDVTDRPYRLPSEAEWEKGARGSDGRIYPWGDQWALWRCIPVESDTEDTTPVGSCPQSASPYGLLDVVNVWTWTSSLWGKEHLKPDFRFPYNPEDGRENREASEDVRRVVRGGPTKITKNRARCASRVRGKPDDKWRDLGIRIAADSIERQRLRKPDLT